MMRKLPSHINACGIEDEFFLIEEDLVRRGSAQKKLLKLFADTYGYRITVADHSDSLPLQINRDCSSGYTCIKFDSTFNTLEIAHPPFASVDEAVEAVATIRSQVEQLATEFGITVAYEGYRDLLLNERSFFSKESIRLTGERRHSQKRYFDRFYHGKICSNQVHLSLHGPRSFTSLARFYQLEPLIPILFSNSTVAGLAHCFRLVLIQHAFEDAYRLFGFPKTIAQSEGEYEALTEGAKGFFRDYSHVVPRAFGTWEFRSACTQPNIVSLHRLLKLRVAITQVVTDADYVLPVSHKEAENIFWTACLDPTQPKVSAYLKLLEEHGIFDRLEHFTGFNLRDPKTGKKRIA